MTRKEATEILLALVPEARRSDGKSTMNWNITEAIMMAVESLQGHISTEDDLKEEAKHLGYAVIKRQKYIRVDMCPICRKKPKPIYSGVTGYTAYKCLCDRRTEWKKSDKLAREEWNQKIKLLKGTHEDV